MGGAAASTRKVVTWLGEFGGLARAAVFVTVGVFLVVAAAEAKPGQAKGVDSALRALAHTPLGPWLLGLVAVGLVLFGSYSCCEARWRAV
jgi:type IV secretory pathway VirB2 component (pilin)